MAHGVFLVLGVVGVESAAAAGFVVAVGFLAEVRVADFRRDALGADVADPRAAGAGHLVAAVGLEELGRALRARAQPCRRHGFLDAQPLGVLAARALRSRAFRAARLRAVRLASAVATDGGSAGALGLRTLEDGRGQVAHLGRDAAARTREERQPRAPGGLERGLLVEFRELLARERLGQLPPRKGPRAALGGHARELAATQPKYLLARVAREAVSAEDVPLRTLHELAQRHGLEATPALQIARRVLDAHRRARRVRRQEAASLEVTCVGVYFLCGKKNSLQKKKKNT